MGIDLLGKGRKEDFRFNIFAWREILMLAIDYGWKPKGTFENNGKGEILPREEAPDWSGTYFTNDGQIADQEDAKNLAEALEKALMDIPYKRIKHTEKISSPLKYWSGKGGKKYIKAFIKFCKDGEFYLA